MVLVMLVLATIGMAACGETGDDDADRGDRGTVATTTARTPPPAPAADLNDVAHARRALIRLADLPEGWREEEGSVTRLDCGTFHPYDGASSIVTSARLTIDSAGVQERIAIYPSVAASRRALRRLDSRPATTCLRQELRRHVSAEAGGPAKPTQLARLDRLGPTAHARRYITSAIGNYGKVIGYIDAVHERVGRALVALVFVAGPAPPDEELYDSVVALVSRRVKTTLG